MQLLIECTTEEQDRLLHDFCIFACERLEIGEPPSFTFVEHTGAASFGSYTPSEEAIIVATEGRHTSDILRTLGHELVHHKQLSEGENFLTLEELEYEANAIAGMLMRDYNKLHPEMFQLDAATEAPPGSIGDSQGATDSDTTRPSGPINMAEDGAVNSAGSGAVAGIGVGPQGEPGVAKKKKSPIMQPMLKRFKTLREEFKDPAIEARKKLASGKIPATAKELLARRKLVDQTNSPKK